MAQLQPQTTPGDQAAIDRLAERYTFREPDEIVSYLSVHPHFISVLEEATTVIPRYFGAAAPLALEVLVDPEDDGHCILFALAGTTLDPEQAVQRLLQFDEEWVYQTVPAGPGGLTFDVESA